MPAALPLGADYARLPDRLFVRVDPTPVRAPHALALNRPLATELGLDADWLASPEGVETLAGNRVPEGAQPIAQAYAGHQFGGWVPSLGDGRAVLLGEIATPDGPRDLVLKGAGRTPYSRGGDGRAWLGPVLREYLVSEAMHAMGLPTTRALAATATGETVWRERPLPGAVLARVARGHVRVGTFQYLAARDDTEALEALARHVVARHYPDAADAFDLLDAVLAAQARLVAGWMGVGFIHGVMNTDNTSISGETIDYGPCAFLDGYHPDTVYSSIDRGGRYAYARQPDIAAWNLAQFAGCLLPLMGERDAALDRAQAAVDGFAARVRDEWRATFRAKLGLATPQDGDDALIERLLALMATGRDDFTRVFAGLADGTARARVTDMDGFDAWAADWQARRARDTGGPDTQEDRMRAANPQVIPRNHLVEAAIEAATQGDLGLFQAMFAAVTNPYTPDPTFEEPPLPGEEIEATFCGT
ncbi:YdiU family protein [Palleronia sediminis]|uniref:Protein nucleotidyltransferase YdiU n=1 Tax=Palleronia sediminis TaxID=2547833 RepID=A0A4R6A7D2_9RHOB|nr:YdiU family protein [Palleronia sediminis]TDL79570.1 YdiU family protein [Palleronia sediminis]